MSTQPNALRLADDLLFGGRYGTECEDKAARRRIKRNHEAAAELRAQHELIQTLTAALLYYAIESFDGYANPNGAVANDALAAAEAHK